MFIVQGSNLILVAPNGAIRSTISLPGSTQTIPYVAYDTSDGNVYVTYGGGVVKVTRSGMATVIASGLGYLSGIAYDSQDGNLYIVDMDHVDRVTTAGVVTQVTPSGAVGFPLLSVWYNGYLGIAFNSSDGYLYVADSFHNDVARVSTSGVVTPYAGQCLNDDPPYNICPRGDADGTGVAAQFFTPSDLTYDPDKNVLYVSDNNNHQIRQIAPGAAVTTIAGSGLPESIDGVGIQAAFVYPENVGYDHANKNVYVVDNNNYRALGTAGPPPSPPPPAVDGFIMYAVPNITGGPYGIVAGPDGNMWFSEVSGGAVGRITMTGEISEFAAPGGCNNPGPGYGAPGSDGNVYFQVSCGIAKINPSGAYSLYANPDSEFHFALGPDGDVWFGDVYTGSGNFVGKIAPDGTISQYPTGSTTHGTSGMTSGPDGDMWIVDGAGSLDQMTSSGSLLNQFPLPTGANGIATGSDGNLWLTSYGGNEIIRVTPTGAAVTFPSGPSPLNIVTGSDGNVYFTEGAGDIGRMTPAGVFTDFYVPAPFSGPIDITEGPDGNIWFADLGANKVGRFILNPSTIPSGAKVLRPAARRVSPYFTGTRLRILGTRSTILR